MPLYANLEISAVLHRHVAKSDALIQATSASMRASGGGGDGWGVRGWPEVKGCRREEGGGRREGRARRAYNCVGEIMFNFTSGKVSAADVPSSPLSRSYIFRSTAFPLLQNLPTTLTKRQNTFT